MNKFEQVSSDDHQMSIAGGGGSFHVPMPQCIMSNGYMGDPHCICKYSSKWIKRTINNRVVITAG